MGETDQYMQTANGELLMAMTVLKYDMITKFTDSMVSKGKLLEKNKETITNGIMELMQELEKVNYHGSSEYHKMKTKRENKGAMYL